LDVSLALEERAVEPANGKYSRQAGYGPTANEWRSCVFVYLHSPLTTEAHIAFYVALRQRTKDVSACDELTIIRLSTEREHEDRIVG